MLAIRILPLAIAAAAATVVVSSCDKGNPVTPATGPAIDSISALARTKVWADSFEDTTRTYTKYRLTPNDPQLPYMSHSTAVAHGGVRSLTSDSNNTGIEKMFGRVDSSVVGMEFFIFAAAKAGTDFEVSLGKAGSSNMGSYYHIGMGFDKSDSVRYIYTPYPPLSGPEVSVNIAPLQTGKWYKCTVEYDFGTQTASFYLDGSKVGSQLIAGLTAFDIWIAYRDSLGAQGPAPYYADDVLVYRR